MKTTSYNTFKEIRTGLLLVIFAVAILSAFKVKEIQVNNVNAGQATKTDWFTLNNNRVQSNPILDAKLNEEPANESLGKSKSDNYSEASTEIKAGESLMANVEYNAKEYVKADTAMETESWMKNGSIKDEENKSKVDAAEPDSKTGSWMNFGTYNAKSFFEAEFSSEIQNRMNDMQN